MDQSHFRLNINSFMICNSADQVLFDVCLFLGIHLAEKEKFQRASNILFFPSFKWINVQNWRSFKCTFEILFNCRYGWGIRKKTKTIWGTREREAKWNFYNDAFLTPVVNPINLKFLDLTLIRLELKYWL
jgi:hypothetical protein